VDLWIVYRTVPTLFSQIRETPPSVSGNPVIWFPTARRAAALIDSLLQSELQKSKKFGGTELKRSKTLSRKTERKSLWQNQFE
jgi:hypothetical protein